MKTLAKTLTQAVIAATVIAGSAGCAGATPGTVTGIFVRIGGPAPVGPSGDGVPLPGNVVAAGTTGKRFTARTGKSGRYTMTLPPGTYHLTGHSPEVGSNGHQMRCFAEHPVQVKAGRSIRGVKVICSIR